MAAPFSFPCCECAAALVAVRNVRFETVPAHMQVRPGTIPQSEDGEHTYRRQAVPFSRSTAGGVRRIFQDHSRYPTGSGALRGSFNDARAPFRLRNNEIVSPVPAAVPKTFPEGAHAI